MRRHLVVFFTCLLLVLCLFGCRRSVTATPPVSTDFSCNFKATYRELSVAGTLTRRSAGTVSLSFTEPETLNGLTASWDGDAVTLSLLGLQYTVSPESIPEAALGEELLAVFDAALRGEGKTEQDKAVTTFTGTYNNQTYTYRYDTKSGAPLSLIVPALPLSVTFNECQLLQ
jgi:hypothetical protein